MNSITHPSPDQPSKMPIRLDGRIAIIPARAAVRPPTRWSKLFAAKAGRPWPAPRKMAEAIARQIRKLSDRRREIIPYSGFESSEKDMHTAGHARTGAAIAANE